MSSRRMTAWWSRRSDPAKVELYTRWTFHFFAGCEVLALAPQAQRVELAPWAAAGLATLVLTHAVLIAVATGRALDWSLGRGGRPTGLFAVQGGVALAVVLATAVLFGSGRTPEFPLVLTLVGGVLAAAMMPLTVRLRRVPHLLGLVAGATLLATGAVLAAGGAERHAVAVAFTTLWLCGLMAFTVRFSAWLLGAMLELDAARQTQARLAVAEERLRFGRDLHDVLGRNLAVIALKSELAVQLAQRGADAAVEQMAEVQRIARESQREMREVVRGYREAGLDAELAGARGVLEAAGVDCRIEADGTRELSPGVQSALAWVVREGTTNVLRHADAGNCTITLRTGRLAVLTMENDGLPDAPRNAVAGTGTGLRGLRERLAPLGGTLSAGHSGTGRFRLLAELPVDGDG
ncbi:histidine kinase [Streptomyces sp. TRM 70351]|uniref:sensor histidine kinase n=1 Tax=Streptomyces sp. TRM 70351 TaxID=3116552 RepID=UPI002E7C2736|nr:histidine kinase [Streptomyces sp. TRM 70351]MEE1929862.1 histidine kinase [Streptomyces sp. TRM 70351]